MCEQQVIPVIMFCCELYPIAVVLRLLCTSVSALCFLWKCRFLASTSSFKFPKSEWGQDSELLISSHGDSDAGGPRITF